MAHADPGHTALAREVARFPARKNVQDHPPARGLFGAQGFVIPEFTEQMLVKAAQSPEHEDVIRRVAPRSFVMVPLVARGTTFGALTLIASESGRIFGKRDLAIAEELARRAAIAIDNARLFEVAHRANASKSEFLANMSHEIRTPMTAVLGYTDLLEARENNAEKLKYLRTIKRNGHFLLDIINDILDLSKIEAGKMDITTDRFAPHEVVEDVRSLMDVRASEKGLDFEVEYVGRIPATIESDAKRLRQVLVNLIGNAIKFTETGSVQLVVQFAESDPPRLHFTVIDTGIGMTAEQLKNLFQPFSQGDASVARSFGGTGLGLAISQRLAQMLNGEITMQSVAGRGSTFSLAIGVGAQDDVELVECGVPVEDCSPVVPDEDIHLDCSVLPVDDRRDVRFLAKHILTAAGASVTEAEDGAVALATVEEMSASGNTFDAIILDMQMPNMDGYETAQRLRAMKYEKPIIALTADAMHGDMNRCLKSGCNDYLSKPIDRGKLLQMVQRFVK